MTVPFSDFPDMVGGVEVDAGLTWDFKFADRGHACRARLLSRSKSTSTAKSADA
jgi:hypothetical protein